MTLICWWPPDLARKSLRSRTLGRDENYSINVATRLCSASRTWNLLRLSCAAMAYSLVLFRRQCKFRFLHQKQASVHHLAIHRYTCFSSIILQMRAYYVKARYIDINRTCFGAPFHRCSRRWITCNDRSNDDDFPADFKRLLRYAAVVRNDVTIVLHFAWLLIKWLIFKHHT